MNIDCSEATSRLLADTVIEPVAVIGIGCRFPGGVNSADTYWNFLQEKRCGIVEIPGSRWNLDAFYQEDPDSRGKSNSRWGGFLTDDVYGFDPNFFDMSPREATAMDPQQRLALQVAFEATQDARLTIDSLQRVPTGVFLGISTNDFAQLLRYGGGNGADIFAGTGSAFSIAANRISHRFGLSGPSLAIDTACSSALVAIDQAVRHLAMGTCEIAFAGGVNCMLDPGPFIAFSGANMLSRTGGIYTFDARADGFLRGEGCGLVLLKRLSQAIADDNRIYGVIRHSMVNQDGFTSTLTAPSGDAQRAMLQTLVEDASIDPADVSFVEAHGTGTPVGDPIEATAIGRVFGTHRRSAPVHVGSYKPNLGHLESAAGIAGFIKALLTAQRSTVLPNLNFERPNPDIPFDALNITVATEPVALEDAPNALLTVVNSFGFGGTNASVAIEQWRQTPARLQKAAGSLAPDRPIVVPVSAQSAEALRLWAGRLADSLDENGLLAEASVAEIAAHLGTQRDNFAERAGLIVKPERAALREALRCLAADGAEADEPAKASVIRGRASDRRLLMTFSGQGGQWWAMARRLLEEDRTFRSVVEMVDEALRPLVGWSTVEEMLRCEDDTRINSSDVTQAAIFSSQIALYRIWKDKGLRPEAFVGHSFGEIAATYSAGIIDLETAVRIIALRGQIPKRCHRRGAMAAIGLTVEQLEPFLPDDNSVLIGAFNGPVAQTITGVEDAVLAVLDEVSRAYPEALARRMAMDFGWHSVLLDDVEEWFRGELGEVAYNEGEIPVISSVTGMVETKFDAAYWWANLRQPVSFSRAIALGLELDCNAFLEIGPHRTLTPLTRGIAQDRGNEIVAVNSLDRNADDFQTMAQAEARLFVEGVAFDRPDRGRTLADTPGLPWNNRRLVELPEETEAFLFDPVSHPLLGRRDFTPRPTWTNEIALKGFRYLGDHRVSGDCLFPAVGYVEIMGAALREYFGEGPVELRDFKLHEATSLADDDVVKFTTSFDPVTSRLAISTLHRGTDEGWRLRAEAYGFRHDFKLAPAPADLVEADMTSIDNSEFYRLTERHGLQYGPAFQALEELHINADRAAARLSQRSDAASGSYFAFPGMLDAALQASIALAAKDDGIWDPAQPLPPAAEDTTEYPLRLPIGIRKILLAAPLGDTVRLGVRRAYDSDTLRVDIFSEEGEPLATIDGLRSKSVGKIRAGKRMRQGNSEVRVFRECFEKAAPSEAVAIPTGERWLVVGDGGKMLGGTLKELTRRGATVEIADASPFRDMDVEASFSCIEDFMAKAGPQGSVLFCTSSDEPMDETARGEELLASVSASVRQLVTLAQVFERLIAGSAEMPALAIVTANGRAMDESEALPLSGVSDSALIGAGRTLANELQHGNVRLVDADGAALDAGTAIADALLEDTKEREFVIRGADRFVPRLESTALADLPPARRELDKARDAANFGVTMTEPGSIDNLVLREMAMPECGPDEALVEVAAVGLNFRDIMAATSILPGELEGDEAFWRNLGLEFAGTVRSVGENVTDLRPGDRVMGMGKGFLRRFARIRSGAVMRVPDAISLEDAASMPVAFLTAHYALRNIANLSEDETALIHLASGGVGLAAIQVSRDIGAHLFGTAGSDEKRAYLKEAGLDAVMNSRALDFAEEVMALTDGQGVDVVLNALSGSGIDKSLECLAPFGRMVEIGKRDLAEDKPIGLASLYRNNSYSVIDLSTLPNDRPKLFVRLLGEVERKIAEGAYQPLPSTKIPASRATEAMRTLFRAQHIGKVVVTFDEPSLDVEVDLRTEFKLSGSASYLVTGGLKGFGVAIADWMSQRGAGTLILANRSGEPDEQAVAAIAEMERRGTRVITAALDVSDAEKVDQLIGYWADQEHPLRGIVHGAAVIEDAFVSQLDGDRLDRVLRPKVAGGWNLHRAVVARGIPLDLFVNMSSVAQIIGSVGQANYTAANSVLNAIASHRRGEGLPAASLAWGMIAGSGFVSRSESMTNYLDSAGIKAIQDTDAAAAMGHLLRARSEMLGFANLDWTAIGRVNAGVMENPRIRPVVGETAGERSRIESELMNVPRERWEVLLADMIRRDVAKVLKVEASALPDDRKLSELGLDSLSAFELKNRIEADVQVDIPIAQFIQAPTIDRLSSLVASALDRKLSAAASSAAALDQGAGDPAAAKAFAPLARQIDAILAPRRPMSTAAAEADNQLLASAELPPEVTIEQLTERLARLVARNDALRLTATVTGRDEARFDFEDSLELETLEPGADLDPIDLPGPLWRVGATPLQDGGWFLQARAHRAAADSISPHLLIAALSADSDDASAASDPASFTDYVREGVIAEGDADRRRDLAYWKEILHDAPGFARISGRGRALARTGAGRNRGTMGFLHASIPAPKSGCASLSTSLLAAFTRALAEAWTLDALIVDRWFTERKPEQSGAALGPFDSFYPVVLGSLAVDDGKLLADVERGDRLGWEHRSIDTPGLEARLRNWLREHDIALRQFGFAFLDAEYVAAIPALASPLDAVCQTPHEVQLAAAICGSELRFRLGVDLDVVDENKARHLFGDVLGKLGELTGTTATLRAGDEEWTIKSWAPARRSAASSAKSDLPPNAEREIAVTTSQIALLKFEEHPKATDHARELHLIGSEFIVRPHMDIRRLERAIEQMRARHEAMRTRFFRRGAGYGAYLERSPSQLLFIEEAADKEEAIAGAIDLAHQSMTIVDPMFRITVIRFDEGDLICAKAHHLVMDGYSLGLIVEETVKAYLGLPLPEAEMDIDTYVREFDHVGRPGSFERRDAFLRELFADPPPLPNLGRKAKGLRPNLDGVECGDGEGISIILPAQQQSLLRERAQASGTTESAMVMAAFAQTIGEMGGVDDIILNVASALRHSRRLENYANFVASALPVRVRLSQYPRTEALAASITAGIERATEFAPFSDVLYPGDFHDEIVARGSYMMQFFTGDVTVNRWLQNTTSAPLQRVGVSGELDMGMVKIEPLPHLAEQLGKKNGTGMYELILRTFQAENGLGMIMRFDTLGFERSEAEEFLEKVLARLAGQ